MAVLRRIPGYGADSSPVNYAQVLDQYVIHGGYNINTLSLSLKMMSLVMTYTIAFADLILTRHSELHLLSLQAIHGVRCGDVNISTIVAMTPCCGDRKLVIS